MVKKISMMVMILIVVSSAAFATATPDGLYKVKTVIKQVVVPQPEPVDPIKTTVSVDGNTSNDYFTGTPLTATTAVNVIVAKSNLQAVISIKNDNVFAGNIVNGVRTTMATVSYTF
jgi:hypothetical protein